MSRNSATASSNYFESAKTPFVEDQTLLSAHEFIGVVPSPEIKYVEDLPFYSLQEERSRKYELLWGLVNGMAKTPDQEDSPKNGNTILHSYANLTRVFRRTAELLQDLPDLTQEELTALPIPEHLGVNAAHFNDAVAEVYENIEPQERPTAFRYLAREIAFALNPRASLDKYPTIECHKNSQLYRTCENIATRLQHQFYLEVDDSIEEKRLQEYLKQVSFLLDNFYNPETGTYEPREKNIAVISGPPAAGKGTTGKELQLEIAASGTEGGAGRGQDNVTLDVEDQIFSKTRDEVVLLDAVLRKRARQRLLVQQNERQKRIAAGEVPENIVFPPVDLRELASEDLDNPEPAPIDFIKEISWYDRYEHFMRGFDRARTRGIQIPNRILTIMFADIMVETRRRLDAAGRYHDPIVLDGAPRNKAQAEYLFKYLNAEKLGGLFYQMVRENTAAIRTLGRAADSFKRRGTIRADELVGIDFDQAPEIAKLFELDPETQALSDTAKERLIEIVTLQEGALTADVAVQKHIQTLLAGGEKLGMVPTEQTAAVKTLADILVQVATGEKSFSKQEVEALLDFSKAPHILKIFFEFTDDTIPAEKLAYIRSFVYTKASREELENVIRMILQHQNEKLKPLFDFAKGRLPARYWQYIDWKYGLIDACKSLGMRVVDQNCDELDKTTVAAIAKDALGLAG